MFFRGYVETKDKQCVEKFKGRTDFKTYEQVKSLPEFAGILAEDTILVDLDDGESSDVLFKVVQDYSLNCRVYRTTRGKHFLFKNSGVGGCKTHCTLAIGLKADIKVGVKSSYEVLKYGGVEREILYDTAENEQAQPLPRWLFPVRSKMAFLDMEEGDGRNQALFNYILTLQSNVISGLYCRSKTLRELKDELHISEQRIAQIRDKALQTLNCKKRLEEIASIYGYIPSRAYKGGLSYFNSNGSSTESIALNRIEQQEKAAHLAYKIHQNEQAVQQELSIDELFAKVVSLCERG